MIVTVMKSDSGQQKPWWHVTLDNNTLSDFYKEITRCITRNFKSTPNRNLFSMFIFPQNEPIIIKFVFKQQERWCMRVFSHRVDGMERRTARCNAKNKTTIRWAEWSATWLSVPSHGGAEWAEALQVQLPLLWHQIPIAFIISVKFIE